MVRSGCGPGPPRSPRQKRGNPEVVARNASTAAKLLYGPPQSAIASQWSGSLMTSGSLSAELASTQRRGGVPFRLQSYGIHRREAVARKRFATSASSTYFATYFCTDPAPRKSSSNHLKISDKVGGLRGLVEAVARRVVDELARLRVELRIELRGCKCLAAQERAGLRCADDREVDARIAERTEDHVLDVVQRDLCPPPATPAA